MKRSKLSLDLSSLAVESFETTGADAARRGTVRGQWISETTCWQIICDCPSGGTESCEATWCLNTCDPSCGGSCDDWTCNMTCETCIAPCVDTRQLSQEPRVCASEPGWCLE